MLKHFTTNIFITAVFLLIWSVNAYIILGNIGKYFALFGGFILMIFACFSNHQLKQRDVSFFLKSLFFYIIFLSIAIVKNQNLDQTGFIFGFICFSLLNIGFYIGSSKLFSVSLKNSQIILFAFLALLGSYMFYVKQSSTFSSTTSFVGRGVGDEMLNPNGVAYTQSLVFLFLFWLLFQTTNKKIKTLLVISIVSVLLILFMTSSRGATLSLLLLLVLFYFNTLLKTKSGIKDFFRYMLFTILILGLFIYLGSKIPFISSKLEFMVDRFTSLFDFISEKEQDRSIDDRALMYNNFYENWGDYLFGQYNYIGYPHNIYMEIFMRWGVFGFVLMFLITKYFLKAKTLINKPYLTGSNKIIFLMATFFVFSVLQSLTSLNLEMNRSLWLSLGFMIGLNTNYNKNYGGE